MLMILILAQLGDPSLLFEDEIIAHGNCSFALIDHSLVNVI